ncbi:MAG: metallophosphoesterase [Thermoguttaceae bacterium]|jgi:hypothetical protein
MVTIAYRRLAIAVLLVLGCIQAASAETWKFLVYGDSRAHKGAGVNTAILDELAAATVAEKPAFVIFTGDLVGTGGPAVFATWKECMQPVYDAGIGVCPVMGNHDAPGLDDFKSMFITPLASHPFPGCEDLVLDSTASDGRSYAFRYRDALFLALDNYSDGNKRFHAVNQTFVDARLADRDADATPLLFAVAHEPAFRAGGDAGLEQKPAERDRFWQGLEDAGCRAYLCGHMHLYADARIARADDPSRGIHQVIVGTAGAPLYSLNYWDDTGSWTVADLAHDTEHYGYVRVVVDDEAQTVAQTWVQRTAANVFEDVPAGVLPYVDPPRRLSWFTIAVVAVVLITLVIDVPVFLWIYRRRKRRRSDPA